MLVKTIFVFLLVMALVGMIGKFLFPNAASRLMRRRAQTCPECRRPLIGRTCACKARR